MKILRTVALAGIAKKMFDEARKPQNQQRIKPATDSVRNRLEQRKRP